jgi:hypothetical protein
MTYTITLEQPDADPITEEGEAVSPVRDVRRLLADFIDRHTEHGARVSTPPLLVWSRLAIEFRA